MTGPERIWIEGEEDCPYFYGESELADASGPLVGYIRSDIHDEVCRRLASAMDDLEAYVRAEYGWPDVHPANRARFDRDMVEIELGAHPERIANIRRVGKVAAVTIRDDLRSHFRLRSA